MHNLDNQIKFCATCNGWGEIQGHEGKPCSDCNGRGVFIQTEGKTFSFELPTFIDFGKREKLKVLRYVVLGSTLIFGILFILFLSFVILQIF